MEPKSYSRGILFMGKPLLQLKKNEWKPAPGPPGQTYAGNFKIYFFSVGITDVRDFKRRQGCTEEGLVLAFLEPEYYRPSLTGVISVQFDPEP